MSSLGKGIRSIRKKDLQTQKSIGVGVKKMVFYHQANSGDTTINLLALSMPAALTALGKVNPSTSALAAARLAFNQDNLILVSSLKGVLMPGSYVVTSSTQIQLQYSASASEIFIGYIDNIIQPSLQAVDARTSVLTTILTTGQTDITFNDIFVTNQYPTQQVGAVLVFRNGKLQMRNTLNATASLTADGNYQEVPTSGPTGNLIRFNIAAPGPLADSIMIVSNGALVERPTDSQMGYIEAIAGQVNSMIPVLADAAGVPTSTFGSNPTSVDLRTFGDTVIANSNAIAVLQALPVPAFWEGVFLPSGIGANFNTNSTSPADLVLSSGTFSISQVYNSNFGTVTQTNSGTNPGVHFVAPYTGTIKVTVLLTGMWVLYSSGNPSVGLRLIDTASSNNFGSQSFGSVSGGSSTISANTPLYGSIIGYMDVTASVAYDFKLKAYIGGGFTAGAGTVYIGNSNNDIPMAWNLEYVKGTNL